MVFVGRTNCVCSVHPHWSSFLPDKPRDWWTFGARFFWQSHLGNRIARYTVSESCWPHSAGAHDRLYIYIYVVKIPNFWWRRISVLPISGRMVDVGILLVVHRMEKMLMVEPPSGDVHLTVVHHHFFLAMLEYICYNHLVGGLEHKLYFFIYWEFHNSNWLSYFSEGLKPPISHL